MRQRINYHISKMPSFQMSDDAIPTDNQVELIVESKYNWI